ncbi:hypothetical protein MNBD_GAMMA08-1547 [hydrothermal vent metagenome]|uniref:Uncharacterized protein n=1 Tax=hydrothermal vent metagenome TaxID=652676 RepID=A0A3B0XRU9_9ZZZZ
MGCWNGTCAVTGLPIFHGDPVVVVLLKAANNPESDSFCEPLAYNAPLPLTFEGEYNDYGGVENYHGEALDIILESIRAVLTEREEGENKYHDLEVIRDDFDIEKLFIFDHKGILRIDNDIKLEFDKRDSIRLTHIIIHRDVYYSIVESTKISRWNGDDGETIECGLASYRAEYDTYVNDLNALVTVEGDVDPDDIKAYMNKFKYDMNGEAGDTMVAEVISNRGYTSYHMRRPIKLSKIFKDMVESGDNIKTVLDNAISFYFFNQFMNRARRSYHVPSGSGSQDSETYAQVLAANLTLEMAAKQQKYWDEI